MATQITMTGISNGLSHFLRRYHAVLFTVLVFGGVAVMIFVLNQTVARSTDTTEQQLEASHAGFDAATIKRLNTLNALNESSELTLPANQRTSPFVE